MYKKIFYTILLTGLFLVAKISLVSALTIENPLDDNWEDLPAIVRSGSGWVRILLSIVLFGVISYGGYVHATAGEDVDQRKRAWQIIRGGLVGATIVVLSPVIISAVGALLGATFIFT